MKPLFRLLLLSIMLTLTGCSTSNRPTSEEAEWKVSPTFLVQAKDPAGNPLVRDMQGQEGKLGIIGPPYLISGKTDKVMWHFWGQIDLKSKVNITAVNQKGEQSPILIEGAGPAYERFTGLGGPNNGADAHFPSSVQFPSAGLWRVNVDIDGNPFAHFVVEVK